MKNKPQVKNSIIWKTMAQWVCFLTIKQNRMFMNNITTYVALDLDYQCIWWRLFQKPCSMFWQA